MLSSAHRQRRVVSPSITAVGSSRQTPILCPEAGTSYIQNVRTGLVQTERIYIPQIPHLHIQFCHILCNLSTRRGIAVQQKRRTFRLSVKVAAYDQIALALGALELDLDVTVVSTNFDERVQLGGAA